MSSAAQPGLPELDRPSAAPAPGLTTSSAQKTRTSALRAGDLLTLTKVRVNSLVVATTVGGYYVSASGAIETGTLFNTCVGTALVAGGAAALNQSSERDVDRLMERTRMRPVADGRMSAATGYAIGLVLAAAGLLMLWIGSGALATLIALATFVSYAFIYTPLKRVTTLSTIVGAVPGALPPLIGWAAARGTIAEPGPWALFLIGFFWQLPHILAVSWMYRDDYARARLPVLAVVDPTGAITGRQAALWAAALIPVSLLPAASVIHLAGPVFIFGAFVLGLAQFAVAVLFARRRTIVNARRLFYATLLYLPLLWGLMILGRR
jgi:protoheme IX farnesyltransferase